jgi:hypothetical protein
VNAILAGYSKSNAIWALVVAPKIGAPFPTKAPVVTNIEAWKAFRSQNLPLVVTRERGCSTVREVKCPDKNFGCGLSLIQLESLEQVLLCHGHSLARLALILSLIGLTDRTATLVE